MPDGREILLVAGQQLELKVRVNPRARRIGLRIDPSDGQVVLSLPHRRLLREGLAFARGQWRWIASHRAAVPPPVPFAEGSEIPILGRRHVILHCPKLRGGVQRQPGRLLVSGDPEYLARRVTDWLRDEARQELSRRACALAARIGRRVRRISVRDTRSRWGSCAADGTLSFSWRLLLAPEPVLDYVVAHEVAHLAHRNHGPAFWALVERLCPGHARQRDWLRSHGAGLYRYGQSPAGEEIRPVPLAQV